LFVSIALKSDPAWDEKGSGVGRREKIVVSLGVEKNQYGGFRSIVVCSQLKRITV
jgi:hypothetical protein